jgi:hypothetical protein
MTNRINKSFRYDLSIFKKIQGKPCLQLNMKIGATWFLSE